MSKALGLLSGGLDSALAAMTLKRQGVDVTCICYVTPFFGASKARKAAAQMEIPLIEMDIGEIHLDIVKNPVYGHGKNMNPCIDCHAMMFRLAAEMMQEGGYDFLFSGEVLGQRPMSQNSNALKAVAKHAGCADKILRPLSAKCLPITPMEENGLVDREKLHDIQGRSRKPQEALAREWGITEYPGSGGGCLLTEPGFSRRLRDLVDHTPECTIGDVEMLKNGRLFRISDHAKVIIARDEADCDRLLEQAPAEAIIIRCKDVGGPYGMIEGSPNKADIETAAAILASYGKGKNDDSVTMLLRQGERCWDLDVAPLERDLSAQWQL